MELQAQWIDFGTAEARTPGYLAQPARVETPLPAVLVIQEIWGVDGHIQDLTERFATAGYVALAPDLYARGGRRPHALGAERVEAVKAFLDTLPPAAWMNPGERDRALAALPAAQGDQVRETLGTLFSPGRDLEAHARCLRDAVAFLREHPSVRGRRVGSTGYCMGGALSALLACTEPTLAAAVIYYGAAPAPERLPGLACPLLGFYGAEDHRISDAVPAFAAALAAAGKSFRHHTYPDTPHAFFNDTRPAYRVEAARSAWSETLRFLAEHLTPGA